MSTAASLFAITGFAVQFVGLGALHYSATAIVLAVSLVMTAVRAIVRRNLAQDLSPFCVLIPKKSELAWLAFRAAKDDWKSFVDLDTKKKPSALFWDCEWGIPTGFISPWLRNDILICDPAFSLHNKSDEFMALIRNTAELVRNLDQLHVSNKLFVLGFYDVRNPLTAVPQCPEIKAAENLLSVAPDIPLGDYS